VTAARAPTTTAGRFPEGASCPPLSQRLHHAQRGRAQGADLAAFVLVSFNSPLVVQLL